MQLPAVLYIGAASLTKLQEVPEIMIMLDVCAGAAVAREDAGTVDVDAGKASSRALPPRPQRRQ